MTISILNIIIIITSVIFVITSANFGVCFYTLLHTFDTQLPSESRLTCHSRHHDLRKSGQLVKAFNTGGSAALEVAIGKLGPMMYWAGKGELITRW